MDLTKQDKFNIILVIGLALIIGIIVGFYIGKGYMIAIMRESIGNLCKLL
jgi:uncharacterized protein YneF (UPF0154 family)